jgi:transcriptional regulator with PAS, ATPase and Fis domain
MASEGTVFLDEVGEMSPLLQVKLLRALQEHEIRRVGGNRQIRVNPRIIAATNRSMDDALKSGAMREDFYFRIAVVTLHLVPLRERREDIRHLVELLLQHFAPVAGKEGLTIDPLAFDILEGYAWPGNIRELENVIERATLMAEGAIKAEDLGLRLSLDLHAIEEATKTLPEITAAATRRAEVEAIERALTSTGGNKTQAAEILGISYKTLLNKVREYQGELGDHHDIPDEPGDAPRRS